MEIVKNFGSQNYSDFERVVEQGGRFVIYEYCISVILFTYRQSSSIYLVNGKTGGILKGLPLSIVTLFLGWWGIPFGPIYTIQCLYNNLNGGRDVTNDVLRAAKKRLDVRNQYF